MYFDENGLLTLSDENNNNQKDYNLRFESKSLNTKDKQTIAIKKSQIVENNLKNVWDGRSCFFGQQRDRHENLNLDPKDILTWLSLFDAFDEDTGQIYFFYPKVWESTISKVILDYWLNWKILKNRIFLDKNNIWLLSSLDRKSSLGLLFGLAVIYGRFDIKNTTLYSIQIQIPLFGKYMRHEEMFDNIAKILSDEFIFINTSKKITNDGLIYQISITDRELLSAFARHYKDLEITKIASKDLTEFQISALKQYLEEKKLKYDFFDWFVVKTLTKK